MLSSVIDSSSIPVLEQVLNFSQARQGVLAGNIANMDTPGYRTRDLSVETFQERLAKAIEVRHQRAQPISPGIADSESPADAMRKVKESASRILFHDESDIRLEEQVTEIAKNQAMHNLALSVMTSQFRLLESAINERA